MQVIPLSRYVNIHPVERWACAAGGGALAARGLQRGGISGALQLLAGTGLLFRGVTGQSPVYRALGVRTLPSDKPLPYELGIRADATITIRRPRKVVFDYWKDLENLPRFMSHVVSVERTDDLQSHWVAQGPAGRTIEWDAEQINEIPNRLIAWKSLPGSDVDSAGSVQFTDAPQGRGTEVRVELQYNPLGGTVGALVAQLFDREPEQEIRTDLARLKHILESEATSYSAW